MPMKIDEELFRGRVSLLSLYVFAVCVSVSLSSIVCNTLLRNGPGSGTGFKNTMAGLAKFCVCTAGLVLEGER